MHCYKEKAAEQKLAKLRGRTIATTYQILLEKYITGYLTSNYI